MTRPGCVSGTRRNAPARAATARNPPRASNCSCAASDAARTKTAGAETSEAETISDTEMEARLVGRRLMELKDQEIAIPGQLSRRATWSDMVILLRSPRHKAEAYVKEFARLGVPLAAVRGGFYESLEVRDLLSLLQVLDNPSQDLPLLGVLRSPLAGLTADELAAIRLAQRPGPLLGRAAPLAAGPPGTRTCQYFSPALSRLAPPLPPGGRLPAFGERSSRKPASANSWPARPTPPSAPPMFRG